MNKFSYMRNILLSLEDYPIYIAGHIKPDQDSVCSGLALARWLNSFGKSAKVLLKKGDESIIDWINDDGFITFEVTDENYNFIALDVNEMNRLGIFYEDFKKAKYSINIDHHQGNLYEADKTLSIPGISSTCEIIYEIIKPKKDEELSLKICEELYSGMMNDTNCFSRRLSNNTLKIAQILINRGIDYQNIIKKTFSNRTMYQFKALAKIVSEMQYDGFYYAVVDKSIEEFKELTHNQIVKQIAEELRKIEGIDLLVILIKDKGTIVGKVMTNISENANKIAELMGGGGHKKEAGFSISDIEVSDIIRKIKEYIK